MQDSYSPSERRGYRRVAIALVLVLLSLGLFPATAAVFDETREGWIVPVFVVAMVAIGVLLWTFVPLAAGERRRLGHRVGMGALAGALAAAVALGVFFALLHGYSGV